MEFYLDTNTLRSLASKLGRLKTNSYTSVWAIIELLCRVSLKDFSVRKGAIKSILSNEVKIEWRLPFSLIADSFSCDCNDDCSISQIKEICQLLISSSDFNDFNTRVSQQGFSINALKFQRDSLSKNFIGHIRDSNVLLQQSFKKVIFDKFSLIDKADLMRWCRDNAYNKELNIFTFSKLIAHELSLPPLSVYKQYNGLADNFMTVYSYFLFKKVEGGSQPALNDFNDLLHWLYIKNNEIQKMVSEDKMMLFLNQSFGSDVSIVIPMATFERMVTYGL